MKLNNAIRLFTALITVITVYACTEEGDGGCPADMLLSFYIDDKHEPGDYDSRLGNDALLYIFSDKVCVSKMIIPYEDIRSGNAYVIRKTENICGNLDIVAWGVPKNQNPEVLPLWQEGDDLYSRHISLEKINGTDYYNPITDTLHAGVVSCREVIDRQTLHKIGMNYGYCRVEVNVTDNSAILSAPAEAPSVRVMGGMAHMDMNRQGTGSNAVVVNGLSCPSDDNTHYTTGRFGILPSKEGETVGVEIYAGNNKVATLPVPKENLPKGAQAGGLLVFEHDLGSGYFTFTINGYRVNIYIH